MDIITGRVVLGIALCLPVAGAAGAAEEKREPPRPTAREMGIVIGEGSPGLLNAITDVPGVLVGHATLVRGENVRTGVTAILPHGGNLFLDKVPAAVVVGNGFGKLAGSTQVDELGTLETPVLLTSTLNVPRVADALLARMLARPGMDDVRSLNPVVGETNDGWLNDIRGRHVGAEEVRTALDRASGGPVAEGSVGAGTGTRALGFKGGMGTASRVVEVPAAGRFNVGVLVQSNFGGTLRVNGTPVGDEVLRRMGEQNAPPDVDRVGSCMIVVATDAPLLSRNLRRLAARALAGMARSGATFSNGSGDYVVAFSTADSVRVENGADVVRSGAHLGNDAMTPLFVAVAEATEEAILNSVLRATTVAGRDGHLARAIDVDVLRDVLDGLSLPAVPAMAK